MRIERVVILSAAKDLLFSDMASRYGPIYYKDFRLTTLEHFPYYCELDKSEECRFYRKNGVNILDLGYTDRGMLYSLAGRNPCQRAVRWIASAREILWLRPSSCCARCVLGT